ncbi:hypothetical protein FACS1894206_05980 [Deltaproteobacteria bacterium]|nr:hypothetical protein FACS1894206_05980 [Deltaproteobacteria bacterium]
MRRDKADAYRNLVEPEALIHLFLRYPPDSFTCAFDSAGVPVFHTDFDLLTTLESKLRSRLSRVPLYSLWSRALRYATCFVGTTVTEYAPFPASLAPEILLDTLLLEHGKKPSLTILKDLPRASPLVSAEENKFADRLAYAARKRGFIEVLGQALAYVPIDFTCEEEYLHRLSPARRKDIRRKMKMRKTLTVDVLRLGDKRFSEPALLAELYAMYREVFNQSEIRFDRLSPEFFTALLQSRETDGVVLCYRHGQTLAGYNICLIHKDRFIDKYIGFKYPLARQLNLYFISWMANLAFARENSLTMYIAGWTDPEVKASLGAEFTFTRHLVRVKNPVLRSILFPLRHFFESDAQAVSAAGGRP